MNKMNKIILIMLTLAGFGISTTLITQVQAGREKMEPPQKSR